MEDITMNCDQCSAFKSMKEFIKSDKNYFLLLGKSGTGKSFILCSFVRWLEKNKYKFEILTPTNKSLSVLIDLLGPKNNMMTLAKKYGWRQDINDDGEKITSYTLPLRRSKIVLIDEISMIDKNICDLIKSQTDVKFLFFGDRYQLPPVGETESEIYGFDLVKFELNIIERQRGAITDIVNIIEAFRNLVDGVKVTENIFKNSLFVKKDEFIKRALISFKQDDDTIILTFTNQQSVYYNNLMRKLIFGVGDEVELNKFYLGEKCVFTESVRIGRKSYASGVKFIITHIEKKTLFINNPFCLCDNVHKIVNEFNQEHLKIDRCDKCHTGTSLKRTRTIDFYEIGLNGSDDNIYVAYDQEDVKTFYGVTEKYKDRCVKSKSKKLWCEYYDLLNMYKTPLSYSYSSTCHKIQGSGVLNVLMDYDDINRCPCEITRGKLMYVGASRTRKNLLILKN